MPAGWGFLNLNLSPFWLYFDSSPQPACFCSLSESWSSARVFWSGIQLFVDQSVCSWVWAQMVKNLPPMQETWVQSLSGKDPLQKGMATHFSILAWRIPQRSLEGYSPWDHEESDMTEWLTLSLVQSLLSHIRSRMSIQLFLRATKILSNKKTNNLKINGIFIFFLQQILSSSMYLSLDCNHWRRLEGNFCLIWNKYHLVQCWVWFWTVQI